MNEIIVNLEGKEYQIDIQKAKDLGILKEKDSRCKSWEEFFNKYVNGYGYRSDREIICPIYTEDQLTQDEALALIAFSQLLKLRRDWIGDWEPDWSNDKESKYCIEIYKNEFYVNGYYQYAQTFSFPTKEMAKEFFDCFKELFEQCKNLI